MEIATTEPKPTGARFRTADVLPALARHWDWLLLAIVLLGAFRRLFQSLPNLWFSADTYYAHGAIVPICAGIVVAERWEKLRTLPLKGSWWPILALVPILYLEWLAVRTTLYDLQAGLFLLTLALGVLFVAGRTWLKILGAPIAFLAFGLPLFDGLIDANTQAVQSLSVDASCWLLQSAGLNPRLVDGTVVTLPNFVMDVGVPCSGMKILLAVVAFSTFFVLIANLRPWRNALLLALAFPLALLVNAFRIALIGVVGNAYGTTTGIQFHDYSGYLSLAVCLGLQYALARMLGWK